MIDQAKVNLGIAVDVEKKDGGRTLMVPVIRDAGRLTFPRFLDAFNELIAKARENKLTADDLQGANVSLTNPGGIGTIASVPRLMAGQGTIVATGAIGYPPGLGAVGAQIGAEKVMTMTSTYDHRIIQGAESGQFLQVVEAYLQGEHGFYDRVFSDLGVRSSRRPSSRPPSRCPPIRRAAGEPQRRKSDVGGVADETMLQAVQAAVSLLKAHRMHGHLAARLDPLGTEPEGDPALDPGAARPHARDHGADPGRGSCAPPCRAPRSPRRCRTCATPTAARSPTRSSTSPRTASAPGCGRRSSPASTARR